MGLGLLLCQRFALRPFIAINAVAHQGMAGIEQFFNTVKAVTFFTFGNVTLGIHQVVDNGAGVSPQLEQVIALEKRIVTIGGMGDHQRLHGHRIFFHQIRDAGIGVDHDFVSQSHLAALVVAFGGQKMFAERPVPVIHRHAGRGVGVHHLFGGNDFQLNRINIQLIAFRHAGDFSVVAFDQLEAPVRRAGQRIVSDVHAGIHVFTCFSNNSRNTG